MPEPGPVPPGSDVRDRERQFHDEEAASLDPTAMPPRETGVYDPQFEDAIIDAVGDPSGKRIVDLGCGSGDLTLRLLSRGAAVTAVDLSPGMVEVARARQRHWLPDAEAEFVTAPAENTGLAAGDFDWVVGKWVLHHLDLSSAAREIRRLMRPDGSGVFIETSGLAPPLAFARRHLVGRGGIARYGTEDEHPITKPDLAQLGSEFSRMTVDFPVFVFFHLLDRHVLKWRLEGIGRRLNDLDKRVERSDLRLRRWSYYMRIKLER
jgi:SAM-dependent methyltransferase